MACNEWDRRYVQSIVNYVMRGVVESGDGILKLGKLEVPLPPSNIRKGIFVAEVDKYFCI